MRTLVFAASLLTASAYAADGFESDAVGAFPDSPWIDVRTLTQGTTSPTPSALVIDTTDAFGAPTHAVQVRRAVSTSAGIARAISPSDLTNAFADVRIDAFSNNATPFAPDWPFALQLFRRVPGGDIGASAQTSLYVDSGTRRWILYVDTGSTQQGFVLGTATSVVSSGRWYQTSLSVDRLTGMIRSQVRDAASGALLLDDRRTVAGWDSTVRYDTLGLLDGEYDPTVTIGNQATFDNVGVVPEPASLTVVGIGLLAFARARRRKAEASART